MISSILEGAHTANSIFEPNTYCRYTVALRQRHYSVVTDETGWQPAKDVKVDHTKVRHNIWHVKLLAKSLGKLLLGDDKCFDKCFA